MKYMGGKTSFLSGALGQTIKRQLVGRERFVDLFSGSAAVSHYVAERFALPVLACDLQEYGRVLSASLIERTEPVSLEWLREHWIRPAEAQLRRDGRYRAWKRFDDATSAPLVHEARAVCETECDGGELLLRAYGGHYFSPRQALVLQVLRDGLPESRREVALASLIRSASRCAASPGHTAQPFQPTEALLPHIGLAWRRDVLVEVERPTILMGERHALVRGEAIVEDASQLAGALRDSDLVFLDPPYSDVHYSRFYHVLEAVAIGGYSDVYGAGRAPKAELRARSRFSLKSQAQAALVELIEKIVASDSCVILTVPDHDTTNGLSAATIISEFEGRTRVEYVMCPHRHSTLGGSSGGRTGRRSVNEAVVTIGAQRRSAE